jgi:hypothetical protein
MAGGFGRAQGVRPPWDGTDEARILSSVRVGKFIGCPGLSQDSVLRKGVGDLHRYRIMSKPTQGVRE